METYVLVETYMLNGFTQYHIGTTHPITDTGWESPSLLFVSLLCLSCVPLFSLSSSSSSYLLRVRVLPRHQRAQLSVVVRPIGQVRAATEPVELPDLLRRVERRGVKVHHRMEHHVPVHVCTRGARTDHGRQGAARGHARLPRPLVLGAGVRGVREVAASAAAAAAVAKDPEPLQGPGARAGTSVGVGAGTQLEK